MSAREHLRIVAIIQASLGSTRIAGSVLKSVAGQPLLWHIVHRLKVSHLIEEIAVATTTDPRDDAIAAFGRKHDIAVVRGPKDDALALFARAAEALDADIVVRVSSGTPFVDAGFVDHLIASLIEQCGDYVLLEEGVATTYEGIEPLTRRALDKLMMDAHDDPLAREQITGYFKLHPEFVQVVRAKPFPPPNGDARGLACDVPDDLAFADAARARLEAKSGEAALGDLLMLLEREPSLRSSTGYARQKQQVAQGGLALIRCDGGGEFGDCHVRRMTALARALQDREGIGAIFAVHGTEDALAEIRFAGFEAGLIDASGLGVGPLIDERRPDFALFDCRTGPSLHEMARISKNVEVTAVIEDVSECRLVADLAYYPPVPQAHRLDWNGSACMPRIGWEWALPGLDQSGVRPRQPSPRPTLLVAMGGCDMSGLTLRAARSLARLDPIFRARFVIGPQLMNRNAVASAIVKLRSNFETIEGADDLANEYASADLALAVFGVTAYDLATSGVPAIYLCLTEDHVLSASAFEYAGMGLSLGTAETVSDERLAKSVWALLGDTTRRREMRAAGLMTLDGEGASRIASDLANALAARRTSSPIRIAR